MHRTLRLRMALLSATDAGTRCCGDLPVDYLTTLKICVLGPLIVAALLAAPVVLCFVLRVDKASQCYQNTVNRFWLMIMFWLFLLYPFLVIDLPPQQPRLTELKGRLWLQCDCAVDRHKEEAQSAC